MIAGSMVRAADMMSVTQPAVSRLIKDLEEELNLTLFNRRKGGIKASEEALILYEEIKRSYFGLEKIVRTAENLKFKRAGQLRIVGVPALALSFVPEVIHDFVRERPNLSIIVHSYGTYELGDMVRTRHYDLGLTQVPVDSVGLEMGPMLRARCVCILPPAHPLAEKETINVEDLRGENFISLSEISTTRLQTDLIFEKNRVPRRMDIEVIYSAMACSFVARGMGVSIIEPFTAKEFVNCGGIARPFEPMIDFPFALAWPSGKQISPLLAEFIESMDSALAPYLITS